jgi:hypothetical protein
VIPPQLRWTVNSELGPIPNSTRNVFVPCETLFILEAEETGSGFNNTGVRVLTPYQPVIILKGKCSEVFSDLISLFTPVIHLTSETFYRQWILHQGIAHKGRTRADFKQCSFIQGIPRRRRAR